MKKIILLLIIQLSLFSLEIEKPKQYQNQDTKGWYMSEKLDGIRAYWNGKEFLSKNGNRIHAPLSFSKNFPNFPLDGELWTKRNDFENIQSIVLDKTPSLHWREITYNIFEAPKSKGDFKKRLKKIRNWFKNNKNKNVKIVKQTICKDKKHLYSYLEEVLKLDGEGLIVKNPNLPYITKRSSNSLKVHIYKDMEGEVIKINYTKHLMKSLSLRLKSGAIFKVGSGFTKKERINPPKIGDIVTFKYLRLNKNGIPRFASYKRIRLSE